MTHSEIAFIYKLRAELLCSGALTEQDVLRIAKEHWFLLPSEDPAAREFGKRGLPSKEYIFRLAFERSADMWRSLKRLEGRHGEGVKR